MKSLNKLRCATVLLLLTCHGTSHAFLSIAEVFRAKDSPNKAISFSADMYIGGMMEALWNANEEIKGRGGNPLYCPPTPQNLNTEELRQLGYLVLTKAKHNEGVLRLEKVEKSKLPASMFLLSELQALYPCPQ